MCVFQTAIKGVSSKFNFFFSLDISAFILETTHPCQEKQGGDTETSDKSDPRV